MKYLNNAFSLAMVAHLAEAGVMIVVSEVKASEVPADSVSQVGHADIARVMEGILGRPVPMNRVSGKLETGDVLYVAQYIGTRLPEGVSTLPMGATIKWLRVEVG